MYKLITVSDFQERDDQSEVDNPRWSLGPYSLTHLAIIQPRRRGCSRRVISESFRATEDVSEREATKYYDEKG